MSTTTVQTPGRRPGQHCEREEDARENNRKKEGKRTRAYGMVWGVIAYGFSSVTVATAVWQCVSVVSDVWQRGTGEDGNDGSGGCAYS